MDANNPTAHYATIKDRLKPREKKIVDVSKRGYRKKEEKK